MPTDTARGASETEELGALLELMDRLSPAQRRVLAMVITRIDRLQYDEDAACALIDRVMAAFRRGRAPRTEAPRAKRAALWKRP